MHIAIYSAFFSPTSIAYIKTVIEYLNANDHQFILVDRLKKHLGEEGETYDYFKDDVALEKKVDFLFSKSYDLRSYIFRLFEMMCVNFLCFKNIAK